MAPRKGKECNIHVAVRCRPRNAKEKAENTGISAKISGTNKVEIKVKQGQKIDDKTYAFDQVFGPESTQMEVYAGVVEPILEEVLEGYNCTVFAYGQTGTGKTHTMEGYRTGEQYESYVDDPGAGIIPRALHHLFEKLESRGNEFSVRVSFLEIYNEELFDLLSPMDNHDRLRLFEDSRQKGSVVIQGLEEVTVKNRLEVYDILKRGGEKRRTSATLMNKTSSRSHSVFSVTIHQKENSMSGEELLKTGKLYMVDLAGSENIGRSGAVKDRAREAGNINQSLLTLGRVISKLVERAGHIPYRESKLTRLLQDSLGGRTKTSIIATISPAMSNMEETQSTLDYANRAKNILNRPEVNQKLTKRALIKEYTDEIDKLKKDLLASREKNGVYLSTDSYNEMQTTIQGQEANITELTEKIDTYTKELEKIQTVFEETSKELEEKSAKLVETSEKLEGTEIKLKETEVVLEETTEEKEDKAAMVQEQAATEEQLTRQATELLQVADTTTNHLDGLHGKIARKAAVEAHNKKIVDNFRNIFGEHLSKASDRVNNFYMSQTSGLNNLVESATTLSASVASKAAEVTSVTNLAHSTLETSNNGVNEMMEGHIEQVKEWADKHRSNTSGHTKTLSSKIKEFDSQTLSAQVSALQQQVSSQQESLAAIVATIETFSATYTQNLASFVQEQQSQITECSKLVTDHTSTLHSTLEGQKMEMRNMLASQQHQGQAALAALTSQIGDLLQGFATEQHTAFTGVVDAAETKIQSTAASATEFQSLYVSSAETMATTVNSYSSSAADLMSKTVQKSSTATTALAADFVTHSKTITATSASITQEHTDVCDLLTQHEANTSKVTQTLEFAADSCAEDVESLLASALAKHEQSITTANTNIEDITTTVASSIDTISAAMNTQVTDIDAAREHSLHETEDAQAHVDKFLGAEIKQDIPTGTTPQRQEFAYPKTFARSRPYEAVVQERRQSKLSQQLEASEEDETPLESTEETIEEPNDVESSSETTSALTEAPCTPLAKSNSAKALMEDQENVNSPSTPRSKLPLMSRKSKPLMTINK